MITIQDLTLQQQEVILDNTSYTIADGAITAIVALNGAGKTSLLRTLVDLKKRQHGRVLFDHQPYAKVKGQVFYLENSDWFDPNLSANDYLRFVKHAWHSKIAINTEVTRWHMQSYFKKPIKKYSLGMKQRLVIALYEISDSQYLLMDEINNGLDEESREILYHSLQQLAHQGKTILITTHYKGEILGIAHKIITIKAHQLEELK